MRLRIAILAGWLAAAALSGCAGGGAASAGGSAAGDDSGLQFLRRLEARGLTVPQVISFSDFAAKSRGLGVTDPEGFLESMKISVRGAGAGRWIARGDLLRACGAGCDAREGMGELLVKFAVVFHRK